MESPFQFDNGPVTQERRKVSFDSLLKFVAALMTFLPFLFGWTGSHPLGTKILAVAGAMVFLWIARPYVLDATRALRQRRRDRGFMEREGQRLREFIPRFARFVSTNDNRAIVSAINSITANNFQLIGKVVSHDYVVTWLNCFQEQQKTPPDSFIVFLRRCQEFGLIVDQFNRNYVQRNQRQLATENLPAHTIDQLEEFKDEFNDFIREFESWCGGIGAYIKPRQELWRLTPTTYFDRVKSFQIAKLPGA